VLIWNVTFINVLLIKHIHNKYPIKKNCNLCKQMFKLYVDWKINQCCRIIIIRNYTTLTFSSFPHILLNVPSKKYINGHILYIIIYNYI